MPGSRPYARSPRSMLGAWVLLAITSGAAVAQRSPEVGEGAPAPFRNHLFEVNALSPFFDGVGFSYQRLLTPRWSLALELETNRPDLSERSTGSMLAGLQFFPGADAPLGFSVEVHGGVLQLHDHLDRPWGDAPTADDLTVGLGFALGYGFSLGPDSRVVFTPSYTGLRFADWWDGRPAGLAQWQFNVGIRR